jgi:tetrahydromethanopterin S-methyltransferase subunit H
MFRFEKEPAVYEIGGVKLGGQPGDYPTIACFSIFQESFRKATGYLIKGAGEKGSMKSVPRSC